jgi:predicted transcriptional regulator
MAVQLKKKTKKRAIHKKDDKVPSIIHLKIMDRGEAKRKIHHFINRNPGCRTSEIIEKLGIDPELVVSILKELKEEDSVLSKPIG